MHAAKVVERIKIPNYQSKKPNYLTLFNRNHSELNTNHFQKLCVLYMYA